MLVGPRYRSHRRYSWRNNLRPHLRDAGQEPQFFIPHQRQLDRRNNHRHHRSVAPRLDSTSREEISPDNHTQQRRTTLSAHCSERVVLLLYLANNSEKGNCPIVQLSNLSQSSKRAFVELMNFSIAFASIFAFFSQLNSREQRR